MKCIDEAVPVWRSVLNKITDIPLNMILNGESIRGPELVTVKNGQKVPIGYDEDCIVHWIDPIEDLSVIDDTEEENLTLQSYELHLAVYGNSSKKVSQKIRSELYAPGCLKHLRKNGISLLSTSSVENNSRFMTSQTYVLRYDLRIKFDCLFTDERTFTEDDIIDQKIGVKTL